MAITIKNVPILEKENAIKFNNEAQNSSKNKASVKFTEQIKISSQILAKAKL